MRAGGLVALALCLAGSALAEEVTGTVVRVADGDTLSVKVGAAEVVRVRLTEIDAPERGQPYSQISRKSLVQMCAAKPVRVETAGIDRRYGRTLGRVFCDGVDANAEQVRRGLAWAFTKYLTDQAVADLELTARASGVGLWRDPDPVAPWDFRAQKRGAEAPAP